MWNWEKVLYYMGEMYIITLLKNVTVRWNISEYYQDFITKLQLGSGNWTKIMSSIK